jgi:hypothetical protein
MYNFLQSQIRKDIKSIVYGEEIFSITLFDKEYFGLTKKKSIGPVSVSWFQVLGLELPNNTERVREEIAKIHYDYEGKRGNIFFQR